MIAPWSARSQYALTPRNVSAGPMAPNLADRYFRVSLTDLFGGVYAPQSFASQESS